MEQKEKQEEQAPVNGKQALELTDDGLKPEKRLLTKHKRGRKRVRRRMVEALRNEAIQWAKSVQDIVRRENFSKEEIAILGRAVTGTLLPKRKPGRKPKADIDAAFKDWEAGMRGEELFKGNISGWQGMSRWRRQCKARSLMAAIHSRKRRLKLGNLKSTPEVEPCPTT